jgi:DNA-binding NarL/FixJ family response regulator
MNKKILIADDHYVVRIGTALILEKNFDNLFIDFAETYHEIRQKIITEKFDLLILDIELPGSIFKAMIKDLKSLSEGLLILIFSSHPETIALQYIEEGANGFLNKLTAPETLAAAIESIFKTGMYYSPVLMNRLMEKNNKKSPENLLSERELQVFMLLAKGNGNLEIANILDIQESTVGTYKRRIYSKLNINNLVDLLEIYNGLH